MWGPTMTGLPKMAGSRILWPPRVASVPPIKTTFASAKSELSSPMESSSRMSAAGSVMEVRRVKRSPDSVSLRAVSSNRSGLRGAMMSRQPERVFWAAITKSSSAMSSSADVLAAIHRGCPLPARMNCRTGESGAIADGAKSYFRLPPVAVIEGDAPAATNRCDIWSDWVMMRSHKPSTSENSGANLV